MKEYYDSYKGYDIWRIVDVIDGYISYFVVIDGKEYEYPDIGSVHQAIACAINRKTKTNQRG